jgi:hypothetical protein
VFDALSSLLRTCDDTVWGYLMVVPISHPWG